MTSSWDQAWFLPGRQIGWMSEFGHRLEFNENNEATCPEGGDVYRLENNTVKKRVHE